jgi:hypothetical protein
MDDVTDELRSEASEPRVESKSLSLPTVCYSKRVSEGSRDREGVLHQPRSLGGSLAGLTDRWSADLVWRRTWGRIILDHSGKKADADFLFMLIFNAEGSVERIWEGKARLEN